MNTYTIYLLYNSFPVSGGLWGAYNEKFTQIIRKYGHSNIEEFMIKFNVGEAYLQVIIT